MRGLGWVIGAFVVLSCAACAKEGVVKDGENTPADKALSNTGPRVEDVAPPDNGPIVRLISAGAKPRRKLRYALVEGKRLNVDFILNMAMKITMPGIPMPETKIPWLKMTMAVEIVELLSETQARYHFEVVDADVVDTPGVAPKVLEATRNKIKQTVGMKATAKVDTRGFRTDITVDLPPGLDPEMRQTLESTQQSMEQLSSPLPAEPVGAGAKWELLQSVEQNGITIEQKTLYEVVELHGNRVVLAADITQSADRQDAAMPGLPAGMTAELVSLESTGGGRIELDLAGIIAKKGSVGLESRSSFSMIDGDQKTDMSVEMTMQMTLEQL